MPESDELRFIRVRKASSKSDLWSALAGREYCRYARIGKQHTQGICWKFDFWSSSENNDNNAWRQNFNNGNQNNNNKNNEYRVRPVRVLAKSKTPSLSLGGLGAFF